MLVLCLDFYFGHLLEFLFGENAIAVLRKFRRLHLLFDRVIYF